MGGGRILKAGLAVVGAAAAFAAGTIISSSSFATASDWLSFAGGIVGAAITVIGAIGVFEWQRGKERRERENLLKEALNEVIQLTHGYHHADEPALRAATGRTVQQQTAELRRAIDRLRDIRKWMFPHSVGMARAFSDIEAMDEAYDDLDEGMAWHHTAGSDLGSLNATGHEIERFGQSAIQRIL